VASPLYVEPSELAGGSKGLVDYERQVNFPNPWPGGWWRLRDIMDYERIASDALLETCANERETVLRDMVTRAKASIDRATPGEAYRIPYAQRDWATALKLAALLDEHHVEIVRGPDNDLWVPLAQPYGVFVREMLEPQRYPEEKLVPGPDIVRPYDVAAWSLPLMMGVTVEHGALPSGTQPWTPGKDGGVAPGGSSALAPGVETARALNAALRSGGKVSMLAAAAEKSTWPAGTAFLDATAAAAAAKVLPPGVALASGATVPSGAQPLTAPRVGLYKPWSASMDEGWTRFLLEQYGFKPVSLDNAAIQKGGLRGKFDAIILPDVPKEVIATGKPKREEGQLGYFVELPPEYQGGLDKDGAKALKDFVVAGGTLIAFSAATDYVIEQFNIPVMNALARATPNDFGCPGSILRVSVASGNPVTNGLPAEMGVFVDKAIAFQTTPPASELNRWVLATYPEDAHDVLLSGWIKGEDKLTRKAAAVATTFGQGRIVLLGFRSQHRAQTNATFPFVFNSLYWSVMK
jgi:hypothetical protein